MSIEEYNICVDEFTDRVYRFILKNARNKDVARDIIQDSFEKLWINCKNVQFEKAKSYIFTTAYHTFIDFTRKEKRYADAEQIDFTNYSHSTQYSDLNEILNQALIQLPEIQRSAILLRDYEGYSYQEIGEITGLNESQVKVYIYRARLALKNYLVSIENVA